VHNKGGIAADVLPSLFDPFARAANRTTGKGLGLGLYIAKSIIEAHGGTIHVESAENTETTVRVRLPRRAAGQR
jgi:signal transduction histidine kinase